MTIKLAKHNFEPKPEASYAAETYGSELAGDIGNCNVCNRPWEEHPDHPKNAVPVVNRGWVWNV